MESKLSDDGWEPKRLKWYKKNLKIEREARLKNQKFKTVDYQLLQYWLVDSERCSAGERLARIIRVLHPVKRKLWFTDEAFVATRYTMFGFNVSIRRFSLLSSAFSVLILGTDRLIANFPDERTLNRHLLRLTEFDWHRTTTDFKFYLQRYSKLFLSLLVFSHR